jgi:hypothetical protein
MDVGGWRESIPSILRDYVRAHGIERTITVVSQLYASVIPTNLTSNDRRLVPSFSKQVDHGNARQVVPERVGTTLAEVLAKL